MDPIQTEQIALSMENARKPSVLHLFFVWLFVEPSSHQLQRTVRNRYRMGRKVFLARLVGLGRPGWGAVLTSLGLR